jgi:hypothetical protein
MGYRCKKCDSKDVESKMWVNLNTFKIQDMVDDDSDQNWCTECQELVEIYDEELGKPED